MKTIARTLPGVLFCFITVPTWATVCDDELYIGYYQESPISNPEDPLPGSLFLNIPQADGLFAGDMFFTYVGCQSQNIGTITGQKATSGLSGTWTGTVDATSQSGSFSGNRKLSGEYLGTYDVDAGKQFIDVPNCIQYYIAAFGNWALFPVAETTPDDGLISFDNNQISLTPTTDAAWGQCQLINLDKAECGETGAVPWQVFTLASSTPIDVPTTFLINGVNYAVACGQFDDELQPLAFSKAAFVYGPASSDGVVFSDGFERN